MAQIRRTKSEKARRMRFSKHRFELFEKASELAILCGVEVAIVGFSPTGKAYSFGHPSVEAVLERFAPTGVACVGGADAGVDNGKLAELIRRYEELRVMIDAEKARKKRVDAAMAKERAEAASPVVAWLDADIRDLGEEELIAYHAALMEMLAVLKKNRADMAMQIQQQKMMAMEIPPPPGFPPRRHENDVAAGVRLPGPY